MRIMEAGGIRGVTTVLYVQAPQLMFTLYSGSKLETGGQFAYQTMLRRNFLSLVDWAMFTQQTTV